MGVRHYKELVAWQLSEAFKSQIYALGRRPSVARDLRFHGQLLAAAEGVSANIVEGFLRYSAGDFIRFLDYALSSLGEAEQRLTDAVNRGALHAHDCAAAFQLARRCLTAVVRLKQSQQRYLRDKARLGRT